MTDEPKTSDAARSPTLPAVAIGVATLGLALGLFLVQRNAAEFRPLATWHASDPPGHWEKLGYDVKALSRVKLPYFAEDGIFRVDFASTTEHLALDLWAQDCVVRAYVDETLVYEAEDCRQCDIFAAKPEHRCPLIHIEADLTPVETHVLALRTKNKEDKDTPTRRDAKLFWVQHESNAFGARLVALISACVLFGFAWARFRHGSPSVFLNAATTFATRRRGFIALAFVATFARLLVAPIAMTSDVTQSAMIYAEDLVQRDDLHVTKLDPAYVPAAKYNGESHMHKPPGTYYQYALPRLIFGFSDIYFRYLTRLPAIAGDLLIAWILLGAVTTRRSEEAGLLCAALYLFDAGVFATDGILARPDSLAIAFLLLALQYTSSRWFSVLLGTAVACKHLALLAVPWFLFRRATTARVLWAGVVTLLLCAPYLLDDPTLFLQRLILPQIDKGISGLVWIDNLRTVGWSVDSIASLGRLLGFGLIAALCIVPWVTRPNPWAAVAITFTLFVFCAKNLTEHYILWSFPALMVVYAETRRLSILIALLIAGLSMAFHHEGHMEIGNDVAIAWSGLLALSYAIAAAQMIWDNRIRRAPSV